MKEIIQYSTKYEITCTFFLIALILLHSLLERPPPAIESRVRDPLGARTSCGGVDLGGGVTCRYIFQRRSFEVSRSSSHET